MFQRKIHHRFGHFVALIGEITKRNCGFVRFNFRIIISSEKLVLSINIKIIIYLITQFGIIKYIGGTREFNLFAV